VEKSGPSNDIVIERHHEAEAIITILASKLQ